LATETRWPNFALAASMTGIRSMLSYLLFVSTTTIDALTADSTSNNASTTMKLHAVAAWLVEHHHERRR
jgi:hypothetical protein